MEQKDWFINVLQQSLEIVLFWLAEEKYVGQGIWILLVKLVVGKSRKIRRSKTHLFCSLISQSCFFFKTQPGKGERTLKKFCFTSSLSNFFTPCVSQ